MRETRADLRGPVLVLAGLAGLAALAGCEGDPAGSGAGAPTADARNSGDAGAADAAAPMASDGSTALTGDGGNGASGSSDGGGNRDGGGAGSDGSAGGIPGIRVSGTQLLVDGVAFTIKGVCWNPIGLGGVHPADLDFAGFVQGDARLMQEAGINTVRTYEAITDVAVLDALWSRGIRVINTVYAWGGEGPEAVDARVAAVMDHPAILMWSLGNEWNYNGLYVGMDHDAVIQALNAAAARIRALDQTHPIASIYGELPGAAVVAAMPDIDVWGINSYRGIDFAGLFDDWAARSDKPMFLGEYGADAYNALSGMPDPGAQADATRVLTKQILSHASADKPDDVCLGGTVFEWADEWWKDGAGSASEHDVGGIAPGGGPHPDATFNEEWWGLVELDRTPRPAYAELQALYVN